MKECKVNFENDLMQVKVANEQKLKKLQEKEVNVFLYFSGD